MLFDVWGSAGVGGCIPWPGTDRNLLSVSAIAQAMPSIEVLAFVIRLRDYISNRRSLHAAEQKGLINAETGKVRTSRLRVTLFGHAPSSELAA